MIQIGDVCFYVPTWYQLGERRKRKGIFSQLPLRLLERNLMNERFSSFCYFDKHIVLVRGEPNNCDFGEIDFSLFSYSPKNCVSSNLTGF